MSWNWGGGIGFGRRGQPAHVNMFGLNPDRGVRCYDKSARGFMNHAGRRGHRRGYAREYDTGETHGLDRGYDQGCGTGRRRGYGASTHRGYRMGEVMDTAQASIMATASA